MAEFENLQFSTDLKPKRVFNWGRIVFNAAWLSVLVLLFVLSGMSFFAYWNVYRSIPTETAEFFVIFDKSAYQNNKNWQSLGDSFVYNYLHLESDVWRSLLAEDRYFFGLYLDKLTDKQAKLVVFSYSTLPDELLSLLEKREIPYVYKNRVLVLNVSEFEPRKNVLPSLFMANNLCFGGYYLDRFVCHKTSDSIKVVVNDQEYQNNGQLPDIFNMDNLSENLLYADNQVDFSGLLQDVKADWLKIFPFLESQRFSLVLWNSQNEVFSNDFALFLTNIDEKTILADIQYYFAYQNRQLRETVLADGSIYQDEVLDFNKFSWQDYLSTEIPGKKLLLSLGSEQFLYAYPFSGNLLLTSRADLFSVKNLSLSDDLSSVSNFSYRKILAGKIIWEKFFPFSLKLENCENLKIEYQSSDFGFSLCE